MRTAILGMTIVFVLFTSNVDCANDPVKKLPKDGSWVKYNWILTRDGVQKEFAGSFSYKIVGTEVFDQKECRWFEFTFIYNEDGAKKRPFILKTLVPEAHLRALFAGNLRKLNRQQRLPIKGWFKVEENAPKNLKEMRPNDFVMLAGLMQDVTGELPPEPMRGEIKGSREEIKSKSIKIQTGKLECKGFKTQSVQKSQGGNIQTHTTRSVWVTDVVPFGFAECQVDRKRLKNDKILSTTKIQIILNDFGNNAKTALPDHN